MSHSRSAIYQFGREGHYVGGGDLSPQSCKSREGCLIRKWQCSLQEAAKQQGIPGQMLVLLL